MCTKFVFCSRLSYEAPFIGDDYWHHLCAMWDTDTTEWSFYLDGVHQISQTKGHLSGYIVQGGGTFHLGQFVQNGAYKVAKAYQGWITGLNIWTTRLSSRTVAALAEEPGTEKGDALSWSMFRRGITGDVQIYNDYILEMTGICARSTLPRRRFLGELEIRASRSKCFRHFRMRGNLGQVRFCKDFRERSGDALFSYWPIYFPCPQ